MTSPSVRSDILERLAEVVFSYTVYPNDGQRSEVAQALIEKHPCLSLKYKCGNYRTKRIALGTPEVLINSLKHKDDRKPAKNFNKPKKAEVNYLLAHPTGTETDDTLENVRLDLIAASKKKDSA